MIFSVKESKNIYFQNLDSLRFIAFLSVFIFHFNARINPIVSEFSSAVLFFKNIFSHGHLGVNLFFVLSGFLITYLLLYEEKILGSFDVKKFWIRRVLRIWPLYFAVVIYGFFIYDYLYSFKSDYHETAELKWYLTFLPNFNLIQNGFPTNPSLTVLWSVGIEEQFYLFWPLLLFSKKLRPFVFITIIVCSACFRYLYSENAIVLQCHTFSVMSDLSIGGTFAWVCVQRSFNENSFNLNRVIAVFIYITGIFFILFFPPSQNTKGQAIIKPLLISLFFCFILFDQIYNKNKLLNFNKLKIFDKWGKYTYALYCIHPIGILAAYNLSKLLHLENNIFWVSSGEFAISLGLSVLLSIVSYKYYEKRFLNLKNKFSMISK